MSKSLPFMRFWTSDYLKDTSGLTVEQHGAYFLVLLHMWQGGGSLPDDDTANARRLGVSTKQWLRYKAVLSPYLTIYGPEGQRVITQKRLQVELNIAVENSARQTEKARKAANEKWERKRLLDANSMQSSSNAPSRPQAPPRPAIVTNKDTSTTFLAAESGKTLAERLETPLLKTKGNA